MTTSFITLITTTDNRLDQHHLTEAESVYLGQIIDLDGEDAVIVAREDVRNGSGRVCGEHLTVTPETWEAVEAAIASYEEWTQGN